MSVQRGLSRVGAIELTPVGAGFATRVYRVADACEHAERTAEPELAQRFTRACSVNAFSMPRVATGNLSRAADVAADQQLHARAASEYETEPISRRASRDRDAVCPRRSSTDARRCD